MKRSVIFLSICFGMVYSCLAQTTDTSKRGKEYTAHTYLIISAGEKINAFFNDKPVAVETNPEFDEYVQRNIKSLKDSWVVVTGKPKNGTFDGVIKTLTKYKFKHVSKNITTD